MKIFLFLLENIHIVTIYLFRFSIKFMNKIWWNCYRIENYFFLIKFIVQSSLQQCKPSYSLFLFRHQTETLIYFSWFHESRNEICAKFDRTYNFRKIFFHFTFFTIWYMENICQHFIKCEETCLAVISLFFINEIIILKLYWENVQNYPQLTDIRWNW